MCKSRNPGWGWGQLWTDARTKNVMLIYKFAEIPGVCVGRGELNFILILVCRRDFSNPPYSCIPDFRNVYLFMHEL